MVLALDDSDLAFCQVVFCWLIQVTSSVTIAYIRRLDVINSGFR